VSDSLEQRSLATIFDATPVGMLMCDARGTLLMVNRALEEIFGWEHGALVGRSVEELVPSGARPNHGANVASFVASGAKRKIGTGREVDGVRHDGSIIRLEVSLTPVHVSDETRILGSVVDISERKELERKYLHAQRLEALGQLAGGVAHDFNNLLTAMIGFASFVRVELPADDPKRADIDEVLRAARRASELSRQLLAFSRHQPIKPTIVDLSVLVADVQKLLRSIIGEDLALQTKLDAGPCPARIDAGQFEQVLMNLAVNARDAMPDGGTLTIETTSSEERVLIRVRDTGEGIPEEHLDRIFQPFFTTKKDGHGTGLGLATCHGIIEQAGGGLAVKSSSAGTTFEIELPRAHGKPSNAPSEDERRVIEPANATILLVEDDTSVRRAVTRMLSSAGYTVLGADSPTEARRLWDAKHDEVDALITDLVLPEMDGVQLARLLRAERNDLVVLFITGYAPERTEVPAELDAALLRKPFDSEDLLAAMSKALTS
jgi:PAS domain S-box-containing protein